MRKKLNDADKKQKISICISPVLMNAINNINNKSKYIEWLIYQDLKKNNKVDENVLI